MSAVPSPPITKPPNEVIEERLRLLQRRIRVWSLLDGAALFLATSLAVGWLAFAVDYGLEPGLNARGALRFVLIAVALFFAGRWLVLRWRVVVSPRRLAELLEARFPELDDRLATAIELGRSDHPFSHAMVAATTQDAAARLSRLPIGSVVHTGRVGKKWLGGAALILASGGLIVAFPTLAASFGKRAFLLRDEKYPRRTRLELVDFKGSSRKVARGRDVEVVVMADTEGLVPEKALLRYQTQGSADRVYMTRQGANRFTHTFRGVVDSIEFEAIAGDDRTGWRTLEVVEPPRVTGVSANATFPLYTGRPAGPVPVAGGILPILTGSSLSIDVKFNKVMEKATASAGETPLTLERLDERGFHGALTASHPATLRVWGVDSDGIELGEPFVIEVAAQRDQPPRVEAAVTGLGPAITPDAQAPIQVKASDDYGVASLALEATPDETPARLFPLESDDAAQFEMQTTFSLAPLKLATGKKLRLRVVARDRDDLRGPNEGSSDAFTFDVVTPDELLARLGLRELNLRQRFEWLVRELTASRRELNELPSDDSGRFVLERVAQTVRKSGGESLAIASDLRDIVAELINNKIADDKRRERIEAGVLRPLDQVTAEDFPSVAGSLDRLIGAWPKSGPTDRASLETDFDRLLARCQAVLNGMLKLESLNEAAMMLRTVIRDEETLRKKTQDERRKRVLDLLK